MTALDTRPAIRRPFDHPDPIYPYTCSIDPDHCLCCFQRKPDMAWCADAAGGLVYRCRDCSRAIAAGRPPVLPIGEQLAATWERLARLHHNWEVSDDELDAALTVLAPHLSTVAGREAVAALEDAMLRLQAAEDPSTVLDGEVTGPEDDPETYVNRCYALAEDAVAKLTGAC